MSVVLVAVVVIAMCMRRSVSVRMASVMSVCMDVRMGVRVLGVIENTKIRQGSKCGIAKGARPGAGRE